MSALSALRRARAFGCDRRGTASIEFAFIAPVLVLFYFALVDLSLALEAKRKVSTSASVIGDLIAQTEKIDATELQAIFDAADAVMQPLDIGEIAVRITSAVMDFDDSIEVAWSKSLNTSANACGAAVSTPEGVLTPGQSVIISEVTYTYTPPIGQFLTGAIELTETFYLRPRQSLEVDFEPNPC